MVTLEYYKDANFYTTCDSTNKWVMNDEINIVILIFKTLIAKNKICHAVQT